MTAKTNGQIDDSRLPPLAGGWARRKIDVGWTHVDLALPVDPDSLLADEAVLEANRQDDYMPYWASLWPAATEMSSALAWAEWSPGSRVLEVGCGLGMVGIAGLLRGWDVLMTDYEPQSVAAAELNAELNGFPNPQVAVVDWRKPTDERFPVILACDVLYEVRSHLPILSLIDRMLTKTGCAWIGDPGRTPIVDFHHRATACGFHVQVRNSDGCKQSFPVRGQFQILELTRPSESL